MNFSLLDKIDATDDCVVATVVSARGHTYPKPGERALFRPGDPQPLHGNFGSLCVDREIVAGAQAAWEEGRPRMVTIDTSTADDIDFGYGTYCGGVLEILLEPVSAGHREVYRALRERLREARPAYLVHELEGGAMQLSDTHPGAAPGRYVEEIPPPRNLYIFGATTLTRRIVEILDDSDFDVHIIDWRPEYLERCRDLPRVSLLEDTYPFDARSGVLLVSHSFRRDQAALRVALDKGCRYVGMLSSRTRRDRMFEELASEGVAEEDLRRVASPAGLDIGARGDMEIAVSIVAQIAGAMR